MNRKFSKIEKRPVKVDHPFRTAFMLFPIFGLMACLSGLLFVTNIGCESAEVAVTAEASTVAATTDPQPEITPVVDTVSNEPSSKVEPPAEVTSPQEVGPPLPFDDNGEKQETTESVKNATQEAVEETGESGEGDEAGVLERAGKLFDKAKSKGAAAAAGTGKWVQETFDSAADTSGKAVDDSLQWATETFESLKDKGLTTANDTSEWLSQDWKNMDSWEYKIVSLSGENDDMAIRMNELGKEGWDCFHVNGDQFFFKRASHSYLRSLPFKDVIKLVPLMNMGSGEDK